METSSLNLPEDDVTEDSYADPDYRLRPLRKIKLKYLLIVGVLVVIITVLFTANTSTDRQ